MENRRKIMMWGCLLITFWLAACHKGDGGKTGVEPTAEVSSEMLEAGQGSTPETETATETIMESLETIPETMTEARTVTDLGKAGESSETDQGEFTWLDRALAEGLEKELGELTEEDYLSVTQLGIYGGDRGGNNMKNYIYIFVDNKELFCSLPVPRSIDICDITKYSNLETLDIELSYNPQPETYIYHYEELENFSVLTSLCIKLNRPIDLSENGFDIMGTDIADTIKDISFISNMSNLVSISLENINLPDDLSPLFSHYFYIISLRGCDINEKSFLNLQDDSYYPQILNLQYNQIVDATILTAMQSDWENNAVYQLDISYNPLIEIGDFITSEKLEICNAPTGIALELYGTEFSEYSLNWFTD